MSSKDSHDGAPNDTLSGSNDSAPAVDEQPSIIKSTITGPRLNRRGFLQGAVTGAGFTSAGLAGCGGGSGGEGEGNDIRVCSKDLYSTHRSWITAIVINSDNSRYATASGRNIGDETAPQLIKIWNGINGEKITEINSDLNFVQSLAFSPDGTVLASPDAEAGIRLWNADTGARSDHLDYIDGGIKDIRYLAADRLMVLSITGIGEISVYDTVAGQTPVAVFAGQHVGDFLPAVAFNGDGSLAISADLGGNVHVWDTATGDIVNSYDHGGNVVSAVLSYDGAYAASVATDNNVIMWAVDDGQIQFQYDVRSPVRALAFSPNGGHLAARSSILSTADGTLAYTIPHREVEYLIYSQNGQLLASGGRDNNVFVWTAENGDSELQLIDEIEQLQADCTAEPETGRPCQCDVVCSCDTVCTCDSVCGCEGHGLFHYWYPN